MGNENIVLGTTEFKYWADMPRFWNFLDFRNSKCAILDIFSFLDVLLLFLEKSEVILFSRNKTRAGVGCLWNGIVPAYIFVCLSLQSGDVTHYY